MAPDPTQNAPADSMWVRTGQTQPQNYTRMAGAGHKGIGLKAQGRAGADPDDMPMTADNTLGVVSINVG